MLLGLLVLPDGGSPQAQQDALTVLEEEQGVGAPGPTLQALRQRLRAFAQPVRLESAMAVRSAAATVAAAEGEADDAAQEEAARGALLTLRLVQALCASQHLRLQCLMLSGHAPAAHVAAPPTSATCLPCERGEAADGDEATASTAESEGASMLFVADGDANRTVREGGVLAECGVLGEAARHLVAFAAWPQPGLVPLARQASGLPLQTPPTAPDPAPPPTPTPHRGDGAPPL